MSFFGFGSEPPHRDLGLMIASARETYMYAWWTATFPAIALALLRAGKRTSYAELATDLGHDSFLLESEQLYALVRGFLERDPVAFDFDI